MAAIGEGVRCGVEDSHDVGFVGEVEVSSVDMPDHACGDMVYFNRE